MLNCCTYQRKKTPTQDKEPYQQMKCALPSCSKGTKGKDLQKWKCAIIRKTAFRFCSEECWSSWLTAQNSEQHLQIDSPVTPAIEPHHIQIEIPLLNI